MENKIYVIVPFYNASQYLDRCVNSLLSQKYDNVKYIFIDDASTDDSFSKLPTDHPKTLIVRNENRKTALENIHNAILNHCEDPLGIVVTVDGDDSLISKNVLSTINSMYNELDCWFLYGSSIWSDGRPPCDREYSREEFTNLRKSQFKVSHIRSWRVGLYKAIQKQDKEFSCLKDESGNFFKSCYDVCLCLPLLEMAGYDKIKHNTKPLYLYNRDNPLNDDKVSQSLQWSIHSEILKRPVFKQIEDYKTGEIL